MTPDDAPVQSTPRTRRYLRYPISIGVAVLLGFLVKLALFSAAEPVKASVSLPPRIADDIFRSVVSRIHKNENLAQILERNGVKTGQRTDVLNALQGIYSGGLFEGQEYRLRCTPDSALADFTLYSRDRMTEYRVTVDSSSFKADKRPVPLTLRTQTLTGVLSTSLYSAIIEAGETPELIQDVIDIFSWDINWFLEPRPGDTFKIVYQKFYRDSEFVKYGDVLAAVYIQANHRHDAFYFEAPGVAPGYFDEKGVSLQKTFLKAPLSYRRISSKFTHRRKHPILNVSRPHLGIDYAAPCGTPVKAAGNGIVTSAGYNNGYGNCLQITHPNGYRTYYGHLSRFAKNIHKGRRVSQNDVIAYVGSTGLSTGPHLDYRVTCKGRFINPLSLKSIPLHRLPKNTLPEFAALRDSLQRALDAPAAAPASQYARSK